MLVPSIASKGSFFPQVAIDSLVVNLHNIISFGNLGYPEK